MNQIFNKIKEFLIGGPLNAVNPKVKEHAALIAVIAWIGLGADGLSSSAYGPEEAFLALGTHTHLALYLAVATAVTVFIIALSYSQVIELFPHGGGGYKVTTHLLGANAGLISGSALIVDYVLTIGVSTAGGVDALFSLLPSHFAAYKVMTEIGFILLLMLLNMRGMKESIYILSPIFLGFMVTHIILIVVGVSYHANHLFSILPTRADNLQSHFGSGFGILLTIALLLKAYSLGGGTYTGLEAVSNNVHMLSEPRVRTGKTTMLYMAISLSAIATGIIVLYLLWHATPVPNQTLNAVVFNKVVSQLGWSHNWLVATLIFEAALLFVGANAGFLGCPSVMANMAVDRWLPRQFRELSSRLVTQNGIVLCGLAAIATVYFSHGEVSTLVVLYSINVFLTFTLALLGLCVYWIKSRKMKKYWWAKLIMPTIGFIMCFGILLVTTIEKFTEGGWITLLITTAVVVLCFLVKRHYNQVRNKLREANMVFAPELDELTVDNTKLLSIDDKNQKTAVFFVSKNYGAGLYSLLWVNRLFPNVFKNYVFLTSGEIDSDSMAKDEVFKKQYRRDLNTIIDNYRLYCSKRNLHSEGLFSYGVDEVDELIKLSEFVEQDYPNSVFFASKLVFADENWWTRMLHNNTVTILQRQLHLKGRQMVILPMKI